MLPGQETAETETAVQGLAAKQKLKMALLQNQQVSQLLTMVPEQSKMCSLWLSCEQCCDAVLMRDGRHQHQEISHCETAAAETAQHACSNSTEDLPEEPFMLIKAAFLMSILCTANIWSTRERKLQLC